MLILFWLKSSAICRNLRGKSSGEIDDRKAPISNSLQKSSRGVSLWENRFPKSQTERQNHPLRVDIN